MARGAHDPRGGDRHEQAIVPGGAHRQTLRRVGRRRRAFVQAGRRERLRRESGGDGGDTATDRRCHFGRSQPGRVGRLWKPVHSRPPATRRATSAASGGGCSPARRSCSPSSSRCVVFGLLRRQGLERDDRRPIGGRDAGSSRPAALAVPLVVIVVLFAATIGTLPTTSAAGKATTLTVDVTGREWFWDVRYPGKGVRTANEIHIPVGASVLVRVDERRRDPQPVGAGAEPEDRRDPRPDERGRLACRQGGDVPRASAPSSAASSTPTWASGSSRSREAEFERWLAAQAAPPPPPANADARARPAGLPRLVVRVLPHDRRHERERHDRARSEPPREPALDRRRDDPEHARAISRAGSSIRSTSSPGTGCRQPRSSGAELQALLAYLESLR